ncbi:MAG: hypothetical protein ABIV13_04755 [Fimbriimonadales bacterium]
MRKAVLLASLSIALVAATSAHVRNVERQVSDYELREACVRWFMPQFVGLHGEAIDRNPKWKNILLKQDPKVLIPRLEQIREGGVHFVEYSAISFVLAYVGHEPAANTRRMFATIDLKQRRPENAYGGHIDDPDAFGHDDIIKGFYDSTFQLYEHNPRQDVLAEILRFGSDGESGYFKSWITKQLFLKYPSAVLRVASQQGLITEVGLHLAYELGDLLPTIRSTLRIMGRDARSDIRDAAKKLATVFERAVAGMRIRETT